MTLREIERSERINSTSRNVKRVQVLNFTVVIS